MDWLRWILRPGRRAWTTVIPKPTDCEDPTSRYCTSANQAAVTAIPGAVFTGSVDGDNASVLERRWRFAVVLLE